MMLRKLLIARMGTEWTRVVSRFYRTTTIHLANDGKQPPPPPAEEKVTDEPSEDQYEHVNPETGERGGPRGPEPTRFGDWERKGRVSDF